MHRNTHSTGVKPKPFKKGTQRRGTRMHTSAQVRRLKHSGNVLFRTSDAAPTGSDGSCDAVTMLTELLEQM